MTTQARLPCRRVHRIAFCGEAVLPKEGGGWREVVGYGAFPEGDKQALRLVAGARSRLPLHIRPPSGQVPNRAKAVRSELREKPKVAELGTKAAMLLVGSRIVDQFLGGRWPALRKLAPKQVRERLFDRLFSACPGFSTREYRAAIDGPLSARRDSQ